MWQPQSPTEPPQSPPGVDAASPSSTRRKNPGRRFGHVVKLKPERADEYRACHASIWPEVAKQIKDCGIEDYSIWYDDKTSLLFASFKYIGYDYAGDMQRMADNAKVREWWRMTDSFQESLVDGATGSASATGEPGWWKPLEEVFYQA